MLSSAIFWIFILSSSFIAAVALHDLYRRRKKQFDDVEGNLALVCRLAKYPYQPKGNENLCIELMTKYRFSPNEQTDAFGSWSSPFLSASFGGSLRLIQFMIANGADTSSRNLNGDSALYLAIYGITCRLQSSQNASRRSSEIQLGILIIDCLIASGCDIDSQNEFGFTPLHWVSTTREKWLVDHLIKRGANPLARTAFSRAFPSTLALEMKQLQIHMLLKEAEYNFRSL